MIEPMSLDRFQELADAYGGVVARWPDQCRSAAMQLASHPAAIAILAQASALDDAMDAWSIPLPSQSLRDRIVARALGQKQTIGARARLWWSGVGIAAALAGAVAGAVVVGAMAPVDASAGNTTSFGDIGPQES